MKLFFLLFAIIAFISMPGWAQTSTVNTSTTTAPGSAGDAVNIARTGVDPSLQDHIVSVYSVGSPAAIQTWWVIFYDPSLASHGRAVRVENGQVVRSYEATSGVVYDDALTFAPSQVGGERPALAAAQNYAAAHAIPYDRVRALLRVTASNQSLRWRVQLIDGTRNRGFVFVKAADGSFAVYSPPGSAPSGSGTGGGVVGDANRAANDIKNTFLGIGGDLQEFFTGERTVDQ